MTDILAQALDGMKVLDLTEERGLYAGKMLADLGADVVLIEKPGGCKARRTGPFKDDMPGLENSLYFLNFNTNKKSVTLNIDTRAGQVIFKQLAKHADVVIEDADIGRMRSLGLDYPALRELNCGIIMASITGFGQSGPYSAYKAPDIVSFAMGGLMNINGPKDAAPVVAPCEQSHYSSSVAAVFGILAALFMRMRTGEGQLIDTSAHEVGAVLTGGIMTYSYTSQIAGRDGSQFSSVPGRIYPCMDGHVHILIIRPNHWLGFLTILGNPDVLKGEEWYNGAFRNKNADFIDAHVIEFTMNHTKMEIAELCQAKGVPCTPVNSSSDFYEDPHIKERGFFGQMEHPVMGRYSYPIPPYRINSTRVCVRRSAPLLGQHNRDVYGMELSYTTDELAALKAEGTI